MLRIRPFRADDIEHLYQISLATGAAGGDASRLYADPKLLGHIYSAPYALLAPRLALVVEDGAGVAGFAVGAVDTAAWEELLEQAWWPALRVQYAVPRQADASLWTADQRRIAMIHRPERAPAAVVSAYPAHVHLNLLPRLHGRGVGHELLQQWLAIADNAGARAVHVGINRANLGAIRFWERMGFMDISLDGLPESRTLWKGRP